MVTFFICSILILNRVGALPHPRWAASHALGRSDVESTNLLCTAHSNFFPEYTTQRCRCYGAIHECGNAMPRPLHDSARHPAWPSHQAVDRVLPSQNRHYIRQCATIAHAHALPPQSSTLHPSPSSTWPCWSVGRSCLLEHAPRHSNSTSFCIHHN